LNGCKRPAALRAAPWTANRNRVLWQQGCPEEAANASLSAAIAALEAAAFRFRIIQDEAPRTQ